MGVMTQALSETQRAFDGVAAGYAGSNAANPILCAMRARLHGALTAVVPDGSRLLDLGCGPGTDAVAFAARGHHVTAIDWSPAMVEEAQRRVRAAGVADRVHLLQVGIHEIDRLTPAESGFDAAYSNFGPLNCVADLSAAAAAIADRMKPGGVLVASVIGRVCPWELVLYAARRDFARAAIRFRRGLVAVPLDGRTVWTQYLNPREFERIFRKAGWARISVRALGLLVPPPYMQAFADRHPALIAGLQRAEDRCGAWPLLRWCGDHFLVVMRKA